MRLFMFESDTSRGLRAFAADAGGSDLPDQFRPWREIGVVRPDSAPPFNLSRDAIEEAITSHGFQLWRIKPKVTKRG
jgi:hypothetical protein